LADVTDPNDRPSEDATGANDDARRDHRQPEHHRGPVVLRRHQIPPGTTDERLLSNRGPKDWVHTDPWRVLRIQAEFVEGFGLLAELPKRSACSAAPAPALTTRNTPPAGRSAQPWRGPASR
jgi:hypothetical protein